MNALCGTQAGAITGAICIPARPAKHKKAGLHPSAPPESEIKPGYAAGLVLLVKFEQFGQNHDRKQDNAENQHFYTSHVVNSANFATISSRALSVNVACTSCHKRRV